ncbi:hypothetical protein B0G52_12778 [Cohnella sp. SGD-V74]|nr:hypothetical protein B0G52_12778 [Cohnella sp. SGD-V74]
MHKRVRRRILSILLMISFLSPLVPIAPQEAEAAILGGNSWIQPKGYPPENPADTKRYAVAFMYTEIWSKNDGTWDYEKKVYQHYYEEKNVEMVHPYTFNFPGRKVKDIKIRRFGEGPLDMEYFNNSRPTGESFSLYQRHISTNIRKIEVSNKTGQGTSDISFKITAYADLESDVPYIVTDQPNNPYPDVKNPMKVVRVFVPIVLEFELEANLKVAYKTTSGQNIDALFTNQSQSMAAGQRYTIVPATTPNYRYVGYKKSTVSQPSGGAMTNGPPETFTYDGKYDTYYLNLYYEPQTDDGTINIRHMVKSGTGAYSEKGRESQTVSPLPANRTVNPKSSYGTVVGSSVSYGAAYSDTINSAKNAAVSLTNTQKTAYVSFFYENAVTGNFEILPSQTIKWRDSFSLKPKDFVIPPACKYLYHEYYFEKDGATWVSKRITSQTETTAFSYSSYPGILGVGTNFISIRVTADCGNSGWVNQKPLEITSPSDNRPPIFSVGFFKESNRTGTIPDHQVVINRPVNLRIIYNNMSNPPEPYDPDGDPITYTFLFSGSSSSWIRSLPEEYGLWEHSEAHYMLKATELGSHSITVIARDTFGAESRRTASINVIPENPIPVITGPTKVKENRPLPSPFSGERSYSPIGRSIAEYIWENKKDVYTTPGTETIRLEVVDSAGLRSEYAASHQLTVLPDEPPIGVLEVPPLGIRPSDFNIFNKSYSPDGDKIVSIQYRYKYDANNNGVFDEPWTEMLGGDLTKVVLRPQKVGKFLLDARVCEDWGKCAWASDTQPESSRIIDVVNLAPSVSFLIEGENEIPKPPTEDGIPVSQILEWDLYDTNTTSKIVNSPFMWQKDGRSLLAGLGRGMESQTRTSSSVGFGGGWDAQSGFAAISDNGLGPNGLSAYRAIASRDSRSQPVLLPVKSSGWSSTTYTTGEDYSQLQPATFNSKVRTNKTYLFFDHNRHIFALNKSKIPSYHKDLVLTCGGTTDMSQCNGYNWEQNLMHFWDGPNPYDFILNLDNLPANRYTVPYFTESDKERDSSWGTKAQNGNFSGASGTTANTVAPIFYEIAGSRIYVVYNRTTYAYYYRSDEGSRTDFGNNGHLDVHVYDAYTGEFLSSSYEKGERIASRANYTSLHVSDVLGDDLILRSYTGRMLRYNRDGRNIMDKTVTLPTTVERIERKGRAWNGAIYTEDPADFTCTWVNANYQFKDAEGNMYAYVMNTCSRTVNSSTVTIDPELNPESSAGYHLVQLKPDFTFGIKARLQGTYFANAWPGPYDLNLETSAVLAINNVTKQAITRTAAPVQGSMGNYFYTQLVDLTTGEVGPWTRGMPTSSQQRFSNPFHITYTGEYKSGWLSQTADGIESRPNNWAGFEYLKRAFNPIVSVNSARYMRYGEYMGDGIYLSIYDTDYQMSMAGGGPAASAHMFLDVGTPTATSAYKGFRLGQFVSPEAYEDAEYTFSIKMDSPKEDQSLAGFSFRMTNPKYRYAVETDGTKLFLSKYVNGTRTVLDSVAYPFQARTSYSFKILTQNKKIEVFLDGVPYFEITDETYQSGKFGPFSDKSYVSFAGIEQKDLSNPDVEWMASYAIWDEGKATATVRYSNITYADPENDPAAQNNLWSISHTPKFLNNQGLSELDGQTLTSPALEFDKVGNYRVTLKAQDDPHPDYPFPDMTFGGYRKWSNEFWQIITVHRRPVAQFTVAVHPMDNTVVWNDASYDPDRWLSPTNYSTENTGIDYRTTRGVLEWRYYYVTPDGDIVNQKLVTPQMKGRYRVGLQVKDEYSAWSYWAEQTIDIDTPLLPDDPPIPGFTVTPSSNYANEPFTITSTAWDKEDGPAANLKHAYYVRNVTENGMEAIRSADRGTWTTQFNSLGVIEIRQVVTDSKGQSAQAVQRVAVVNRKPVADFDWLPKPAYEGDTITLLNRSSDPDGDPLSFVWTIKAPDGFALTGFTKEMTIPGNLTENRTGAFTVTLSVTDSHGAGDAVTKQIPILPLTVAGQVAHTPEWERNRLTWNAKYPAKFRESHVFWAGEAFVLSATVTDTGSSATKAVSVTAQATPELLKSLTESPPGSAAWAGLLRQADTSIRFVDIPDGSYSFVFTATYSNGVVKTSVVPIEIRGIVDQFVQVHRVQ